MKKVFRLMAIAAITCGLCMNVGCGKDEEDGDGNGGNNTPVVNPENLPTTIDEHFDNGMPEGWVAIDADGDGYNWVLASQSWFATNGTGNAAFGIDGSDCMASASFINGINALTTDQYLVLPKLYIPEEGRTLTYQVTNYQAQYPDQYSVVVGTLENGTFNVTATLQAPERVNTGIAEETGYTARTISLNDYKDQSIYIAFRHNDSDAYWLFVDDVKVE
ncbi:MAG: choice-of-anchor J domain-containing protein [Bacteroidales bacterium]|nr:choice-of-anchor J domain-containing protein [Bacteroidales bacterium]